MRVGIAADHGGFALKQELAARLKAEGHEVVDFGAATLDPNDDYPDFVAPLARAVAAAQVERGVAICGSGVGACVCANKVNGVRAALIEDHFSARQGVEDDHLNVLCLGGRTEGPAVWQSWAAFRDADWNTLLTLDDELTALRPSASVRRSSRAMGVRLLTTWQALYPDARIEQALALARRGGRESGFGPTLPVAFGGACACAGVARRRAVAAFAYTRLAATVSAAMRLIAIGQSEAHAILARTLDRVPDVVDDIARRDARIESFAPAADVAAMTQQYVHSRLFRS